MPFTSKAQMRGAFAGAFGPTMQAAARHWAADTDNPKALPDHVKRQQPTRRKAMIDKLLRGK